MTLEQYRAWAGMHKQLEAWAQEEELLINSIKAILVQEGISMDEFDELLGGCRLAGAIEITSEATGSLQDPIGKHQIYVDQWNNGPAEDSYAGYIYASIAHRKWLKIPFEC